MLPETRTSFKTTDPALQLLYNTAVEKCLRNVRLFGNDPVLVEGGGYEKIWLETQPMGGEMYAGHHMTAALNNQLFFINTQRKDGRLPGSIQCMDDGTVEPQFNKFQGFCFPWHALNMYYWIGEDRSYLDRLAACLERFDEYLWKTRDSNHDGLLESFCVYDTGEDNAVRFADAPNYCTTDTPPEGYAVVPMASMDITSFSYAARDTLTQISRIRGDGREEFWQKAADSVAGIIREKLWDASRGACYDKDKNGHVVDVLVHNNLRCMYWGSFSKEMADQFVLRHLLNPDEFMTPLPLPSVAVNDPMFRNAPENNWSGQCEGLTYQRAILALERYGYEKLVTKLGKRLFQAVIDGGYVFTQQFDPFTGAPSRVGMYSHNVLGPDDKEAFQDAYGPTILSVLEYIGHIWGIDQQMGEIWFSLGKGSAYEYELNWGDKVYRIESNGMQARILINGELRYCMPCGIRVITDQSGILLRTRPIE